MEMMVKSLFLIILSTSAFCQDYIGPIGDKWEKFSKVVINEATYLNQNTVIKVDRLELNAPIITNGYQLDIQTQEIIVTESGAIIAFDKPAPDLLETPPAPANMGTPGVGQGGHGGTGEEGVIGFNGNDGNQNPAPINISSLYVIGVLRINGNGQQGGQGGKGGPGSAGGNGVKGVGGYVDIDCKCHVVGSIPKRSGGPGGNGGAGGIGGSGGKGGKAGKNIELNLLLPQEKYTYTQLVGQPGKPGLPGDHGPSGTPGAGGSGATDTAECMGGLYKCSESVGGGRAGKALKQRESQEQYKIRFGQKGDPFTGEVSPKKAEDISYIQEQKIEVLNKAHKFQIARFFQILILDSLRIATNSQLTREQIAITNQNLVNILKNSDKEIIRNIRLKWEHYLTKDLNSETQENIFVEQSRFIIDSFQNLEAQNPDYNKFKIDLNRILSDNKKLMEINLSKFSRLCTNYLALLSENKTSALFERLNIPVCSESEIKDLVKNPHKEINLSQKRNTFIYPENALGENALILADVNNSRDIAQLAEVILIRNRRYKERDVIRPNPDKSDATKKATLESISLPTDNEINLNNLGIYLKVMRMGGIN